MTAEEHNKTLGTLHFIYGAIHGLTLVGLLILILFVVLATPAAANLSLATICVVSKLASPRIRPGEAELKPPAPSGKRSSISRQVDS